MRGYSPSCICIYSKLVEVGFRIRPTSFENISLDSCETLWFTPAVFGTCPNPVHKIVFVWRILFRKKYQKTVSSINQENSVYAIIHPHLTEWFTPFTLTAILSDLTSKYLNEPLFVLKQTFENLCNFLVFLFRCNFYMFDYFLIHQH